MGRSLLGTAARGAQAIGIPDLPAARRVIGRQRGGGGDAGVARLFDVAEVPDEPGSRFERIADRLDLDRICVVLASHIQQARSRAEGRGAITRSARQPRGHDDELVHQERMKAWPHACGELLVGHNRIRSTERLLGDASRSVRDRLGRPHFLPGHVGGHWYGT